MLGLDPSRWSHLSPQARADRNQQQLQQQSQSQTQQSMSRVPSMPTPTSSDSIRVVQTSVETREEVANEKSLESKNDDSKITPADASTNQSKEAILKQTASRTQQSDHTNHQSRPYDKAEDSKPKRGQSAPRRAATTSLTTSIPLDGSLADNAFFPLSTLAQLRANRWDLFRDVFAEGIYHDGNEVINYRIASINRAISDQERTLLKACRAQQALRHEINQQQLSGTSILCVQKPTRYRHADTVDSIANNFFGQNGRIESDLKEFRKSSHAKFLAAVVAHQSRFEEYHRLKHVSIKNIHKRVIQHHQIIERREQQKREKMERERLRALKEDDFEAYLKLVDEAKNERLKLLLHQTDQYLMQIGAMVEQQKHHESAGVTREDATVWSQETDPTQITQQYLARRSEYYTIAHTIKEEVHEQPSMLIGGSLKQYQIAGLQWLLSLYNNNLNGVLADEMGLGKTIQTISLVAHLMEKKGNNGPYLVIVPLSTLPNWRNEFHKWAPDIKTLTVSGGLTERKEVYKQSLVQGKFNVVLTTYEYIIRDKAILSKTNWEYMIVDEGHRMKNHSSKLSTVLAQNYKSRYRLLITGTPLQNNLHELWSLLNFLLPTVFNSVDNFEMWFNAPFSNSGEKLDCNEEERFLVINRLHQVLRPFLLRRLKSDVENQLPDKVEYVLRCDMSAMQHVMYEQLRRSSMLTLQNQGKMKSLQNSMMQLRKVCNHPYLFFDEIPSPCTDEIYRSSGKFELLDRILPKLKASGHRVLLFSQMTSLLDLLETYLTWRGTTYMRLDGHTKSEERGNLLAKFNAPNSEYFIFLLSTRAGGLGLNLQTADTVIIYDSDWNPHMDLQAQDRAHRIGQKNEVRVFRLSTINTVEGRVLARASDKRTMEEQVIQAGLFNNKSNDEERKAYLEAILSREENVDEDVRVPDDEEINEMLARSEEEFELFQSMDEDMVARASSGKKSSTQRIERLMTLEEVPDYMKAPPPNETDDIMDNFYGRGCRMRPDVVYNDGLTDDQFAKLVDSGKDVQEFVKDRRNRRAKDALATPGENTPAPSRRKASKLKRRKSRTRSSDDDSSDESDSSSDNESENAPKSSRDATASTSPISTPTPRRPAKKQARTQETPVVKGRASKKPESRSKPGTPREKMEEIFNAIRHYKDETERLLAFLFIKLPSKILYPDYYQIITSPIDLTMIKKRIATEDYTPQDLEKDFNLIFENAQTYNEPGSLIYQDAVFLLEMFRKMYAERFGSKQTAVTTKSRLTIHEENPGSSEESDKE
eukprot:TRINITY_DN3337_c0_g1_i2.p1 TRINITY_DN3337_c0_g1~~TRINITY_DN3337_c0_g1_i2.p1  ORF type:complete len:1271 (+),score=224.39 TRINITY_DN3337_c0_g1_i2:858-4670(+)